MRSHKSQHGFTLVELLAVIAIIGILVSLLLPAVQSAREAGRLAQCANHLRQLCLGVNHHLQTHGTYPASGHGYTWVGDPDKGFGIEQPGGWIYNILPYIEQGSLHQLGDGMTGAQRTAAYQKLLTTPLSILHCPSRRPTLLYRHRGTYAYRNPYSPRILWPVVKSDYSGNGGTVQLFQTSNFYAKGYGPRPPIARSNGIFWPHTAFPMEVVTDGTSNTLLIGEHEYDPGRKNTVITGGIPQHAYIGHDPDVVSIAGPAYPPTPDGEQGNNLAFFRFGGPHAAGVQFALCDGSVRIISYTLNLQVYGYLANRRDGEHISEDAL